MSEFTQEQIGEITERIDAGILHLRAELLTMGKGEDDVFFHLGVVGSLAAYLFLRLLPEMRSEILELFITTLRNSIQKGDAAKGKEN